MGSMSDIGGEPDSAEKYHDLLLRYVKARQKLAKLAIVIESGAAHQAQNTGDRQALNVVIDQARAILRED